MFYPATPPHVLEDIIDQIERVIFDETLPPGQRLPSERELQKIFQASRSTVREALKIIAQKGLLEIRTGSKGGAFVIRPGGDQIGLGISQLIRFGDVTFTQITDFRQGVETLAVELAARNATAADVVKLKTLIEQLQEELERGPKNWRNFFIIESRLHQAILPMTGNPLYEQILTIIHFNLWKYYEMLPRLENVLVRAYRDWSELVAAIEDGDVFLSTRIMVAHLLEYHRHLKDYFQKEEISERDMARILFDEEPPRE